MWRLTGHGTLKVRATGVEKVLGLAFRGGQLYALEMSTAAGGPTPGTGAIVRVKAHGPAETVVSGLTFPTGMTIGPDGAFYVSNQGFGFPAGQARSSASNSDRQDDPGSALNGPTRRLGLGEHDATGRAGTFDKWAYGVHWR